MSPRSRHRMSDEELGELLRRGDPAADGSELTAAEASALREEILRRAEDAVPATDAEPTGGVVVAPHRWSRAWRLAAAAGIAAALVALASLWNGGDVAVDGRVAESRSGTPAATSPGDTSAGDSGPGATPRLDAAAPSHPDREAHDAPAVSSVPRPPPPRATAEVIPPAAQAPGPGTRASQRRRVEFVAPGGTRIIWVLDPDLDLSPSTLGPRVPRGQGAD